MIVIRNTQRKIKIDKAKIAKEAQDILDIIKYPDFDLGIWFTSNKTIREYNAQYRNKDKATDVLSFSYHPNIKPGQKIKALEEEDKNLGDLILAPEYILKQCKELKVDFEPRLTILLIHGICHLLGYDHILDQEFRQMRAKEVFILKKLQEKQS